MSRPWTKHQLLQVVEESVRSHRRIRLGPVCIVVTIQFRPRNVPCGRLSSICHAQTYMWVCANGGSATFKMNHYHHLVCWWSEWMGGNRDINNSVAECVYYSRRGLMTAGNQDEGGSAFSSSHFSSFQSRRSKIPISRWKLAIWNWKTSATWEECSNPRISLISVPILVSHCSVLGLIV